MATKKATKALTEPAPKASLVYVLFANRKYEDGDVLGTCAHKDRIEYVCNFLNKWMPEWSKYRKTQVNIDAMLPAHLRTDEIKYDFSVGADNTAYQKQRAATVAREDSNHRRYLQEFATQTTDPALFLCWADVISMPSTFSFYKVSDIDARL